MEISYDFVHCTCLHTQLFTSSCGRSTSDAAAGPEPESRRGPDAEAREGRSHRDLRMRRCTCWRGIDGGGGEECSTSW